MASTYWLLIWTTVLLTTASTQGQTSSCPLDSCDLTDQVQLCQTSGTSAGMCPSSCSTALQGSNGGSTSVEECCNNIVELIRNTPQSVGNEKSCTGTAFQFGDTLENVEEARAMILSGDIVAGTYITNQTGFKFNCSGCISSIQLAVRHSSMVRDGQGNESITFHLFNIRMENNLIIDRRESFTWNSTVMMNTTSGQGVVIKYHPPQGSADVCFKDGDKFGFSIEAGSGVALITRFTSEEGDFVLNVSSQLSTSGCPQLNNNGLYQFNSTSDHLALSPLIHIEAGPVPVKITTTESRESTTVTQAMSTVSVPTSNVTSEQLTPSTDGLSTANSTVPGYVIYAAAGFAGIIIILLLVVIVVVAIYAIQRKKNRSYHFGQKNQNFDSPLNLNDDKNSDISMMKISPRMSRMLGDSHARQDIITFNNPMADPADFAHHYDLPSELNHGRTTHLGVLSNGRKESYVSMQTMASSISGSVSQMSKTYDSAPELGTTPLMRRHGGTVKNPLYQATGPEPTYDNPAELIVHDKRKVATFGTSFDGDGIYTETGALGTPVIRTSSYDDDSHYSPPPDEFDNVTTFNPYHELLPGEVDEETGHHYFFLDPEKKNFLQSGSLGRHRVYEPGLYVPDAEERKRMTMRRGENPDLVYEFFEEKHRKHSGKKKKFFREEDQFWRPDEEEDKIYNQLSEKQYREILRGQITFEDHLGVGQFGSVCKATWSNEEGAKKVAVKTLKPTMLKEKKVKFLQEAAIMGQFFHSNVIRLFGVVTVGEPVMIVMELMGLGDLSKYLWENYRLNKKAAPQPITLLSFCRQVACGMKYLAKKKYVHRDLAARNVFINETLVCKIGDFGMSRHLEENYYLSSGGTVPIKWTAPEGLNYKKFSTASDVYSYGMLLYEIWSLGEKPLANIKITDVANVVTQGYCQPPPPGCPRKIYETMVKCWDPQYNQRPSFDDLFELLNRTDSDVLSWSEEDRARSSLRATQIGAPVSDGANLFQDLQKTYQVTLV